MRFPATWHKQVICNRYAIHLTLFLFSLGCSYSSNAQFSFYQYNYDSLKHELGKKKSDAEKIQVLDWLLEAINETESVPVSTYTSYLEQMISLQKKSDPAAVVTYQHYLDGITAWRHKEHHKALQDLKQAIEGLDKLKKPAINLLTSIRLLFNQLNSHEDRYKYYTDKLQYYRVNGPVENTGPCYHGLGGYFAYAGDMDQAISNYLKAAAIYKKFSTRYYNNEIGVAGVLYAQWGNAAKSKQYLNEIIPAHKILKDSGNITYALSALVKLSVVEKNYIAAHNYADEALRYGRKVGEDLSYIQILDKAMIFLHEGKTENALPFLRRATFLSDSSGGRIFGGPGKFEMDYGWYLYYKQSNNLSTALAFLKTSYHKAITAKVNDLRLKYLRELATVSPVEAEARRYLKAYFRLDDSLQTSINSRHIAQYENEQKEVAQNENIARLKQERAIQDVKLSQRNKVLVAGSIVILLILLLCALIYRQLNQNRKILNRLKSTQQQLVQSEKMASLGELTAGIAHEIQNPLNFINNFSEVSAEIADEINEAIKKDDFDEAINLSVVLKDNLEKIVHHGNRADNIVKSMLMHSRKSDGAKETVDVNEMVDEFLRLSYHGLRAKDKSFNAILETHFDPNVGSHTLARQDFGRVLVNLFSNAFYSVNERKKKEGGSFQPTVAVSTKKMQTHIEITVKDNGVGIPQHIMDKIYQPFFTTKPTGEGTGLGLSHSYDIITKGHGGKIEMINTGDQGVEFQITLPADR